MLCRATLLLVLMTVLAGCSSRAPLPEQPRLHGEIDYAPWPEAVVETSGLAWSDGRIWTLNDSGNAAELFALDLQGNLQRRVQVTNVQNRDWEALAQDRFYLYVADCGNNRGQRAEFQIYRVSLDALQAGLDQVEAETLRVELADYQTPDSKRHNFDCEALTVVDDELWLFTKNRGDGNSRLYRLQKDLPSQRVAPSAELPVDGLITGADYDPVGKRLVLLGYSRQRIFGYSFIWLLPVRQALPDWNRARRIYLSIYAQWEAISWLPEGRLLLTCESSPLLGVGRGLITPVTGQTHRANWP